MGQRSQIYIKVKNFGKDWAAKCELDNKEKWRDNLEQYVEHKTIYEKWKAMYGEGDTVIVAFHHQWLYGRAFLQVASHIMFAVKSIIKYKHCDFIHHAYTECNDFENPNEIVEWMRNIMRNMFDAELSKYSRAAVERLWLLNEEHVDDKNLAYCEDFTIGDNNDGVLLMDFTEENPKYCFININDANVSERVLPYMKPIDAREYVLSYYAEDLDVLVKNQDKPQDAKEIAELVKKQKQNITVNKKFIKRFKGYNLLTVEQIIEMFPKLENELINCNVIETKTV